VLEGTSGEGVHAVDIGLMANESLASESNCDVFVGWVPYLRIWFRN
jgi:hypothetical protein